MEKALDILKEIKNQKPFVYILTSVWCRALVVNEHSKLDEAIAELEEAMKPKTCEWYKEDEEDWRGQCGCIWGFNGENPTMAEAYFCPQCGGKIIEIDIASIVTGKQIGRAHV